MKVSQYIYLSVCLSVCIFVSMYLCICLYQSIYLSIYLFIYLCTYVCGWMDGCMHECMDVWMYSGIHWRVSQKVVDQETRSLMPTAWFSACIYNISLLQIHPLVPPCPVRPPACTYVADGTAAPVWVVPSACRATDVQDFGIRTQGQQRSTVPRAWKWHLPV